MPANAVNTPQIYYNSIYRIKRASLHKDAQTEQIVIVHIYKFSL